MTRWFEIATNPATVFTEALALNVASALYNIQGVPNLGGQRYLIRAIKAITTENFGPEFNFFTSKSGLSTTDPSVDTFLSRFAFTSAMGEQLGATGLWRYYNDGMAIPYFDADNGGGLGPGSLHVILQNVSETAKLIYSAGPPPTGSIQATFYLEPPADF